MDRIHAALQSVDACPLSTGWRREPSDKWHHATRGECTIGAETRVRVGTCCHAPLRPFTNLPAARRRPPPASAPTPTQQRAAAVARVRRRDHSPSPQQQHITSTVTTAVPRHPWSGTQKWRVCGCVAAVSFASPQLAAPVHTPRGWSTVEQLPLCEAPVPAVQDRQHLPHTHPAGQTPPPPTETSKPPPLACDPPSSSLPSTNTGTALLLVRATVDGHAMDASADGAGTRDARSSAAYPSRQSPHHTSPHPPWA